MNREEVIPIRQTMNTIVYVARIDVFSEYCARPSPPGTGIWLEGIRAGVPTDETGRTIFDMDVT